LCVIIIADKKNPPKSLLKKAEAHNRDGAGISWIDQKEKCVRWIKGKNLTTKKIRKIIKDKKIGFPYIIHFRIGTVGSVSDQLSHPFPLSNDIKNRSEGYDYNGVLFHNGHYDKWANDLKMIYSSFRENIPNEKMSDSRAISLLASKSKLGLGYLRTFQDQKIAVLTPNGIKKYGSDWCKVEKFTCSNDHFDWTYESCENETFNSNSFNDDDLDGTKNLYDMSDEEYQQYLEVDEVETYDPKIKKRDRSVSYCQTNISKEIKEQDDLCRSLEEKHSKKRKKKKKKTLQTFKNKKEVEEFKVERIKDIVFKMNNCQYETSDDMKYDLNILKTFTENFKKYKEYEMPNFDKINEKITNKTYFKLKKLTAKIIENAKSIDNTVDQELDETMESKKQTAMYELEEMRNEIMPITRGVKYEGDNDC